MHKGYAFLLCNTISDYFHVSTGYIIYTLVILLIGSLILGMYLLFKYYPDNAKLLLTYIT